jgi:hypothetical protein
LGIRFGVIGDARRRQRRRRVALAVPAVAATIVAAMLAAGGPARRAPAPPREIAVPARAALPVPPFLGVACLTPNSIACDRVGVYVKLRRPAVSVRAELNGYFVPLGDPSWSPPAHNGYRKAFAGFLAPAGLRQMIPKAARPHDRWTGRQAPSPVLLLHIDYGNGRRALVRTRAQLGPGWG